jgi:DNA-binding PadR family transcriptional regulator
MNTPFEHSHGPLRGHPGGLGFGFGPAGRRELHGQRREARRHLHDALRDHAGQGEDWPVLPNFGSGFGPGFGRGFGPGFGPGTRRDPGQGGRGRGRGRGRRGDVRAAILKLLAERPMHGYEMIQEIAERSNELWKPSPGSVYPTLQLLEDEGLIVSAENEGSKKLFELTEEGRAEADKTETAPWTEIAEGADPTQMNLRHAIRQLIGAVRQSAFTASSEQQQRIVGIVNNARREIYQILGEE